MGRFPTGASPRSLNRFGYGLIADALAALPAPPREADVIHALFSGFVAVAVVRATQALEPAARMALKQYE
ncbi:MAG: hypothetical protein V4671_01950 [Armatimonadota bacterium]